MLLVVWCIFHAEGASGLFPSGVKRPEREDGHSTPSRT